MTRQNVAEMFRLHARRISALGTFLVVVALGATTVMGAKKDKDQSSAFIRGLADESGIAREVRHQLLMLPYYGVFDDLSFRVDGGTVTLFGDVVRPTLKSDAENVVKRLEGVERVINKIEVLPPSTMDDQIRMAEYRAIFGDPALSTRYGYRAIPPVHIIVKNGNVRLEGVVASEADKNLINIRANGVPNVFSVVNNLQVEGA